MNLLARYGIMASQSDGLTYLYNEGDEITALTGGWNNKVYATYGSGGSFTKYATTIKSVGSTSLSSGECGVSHVTAVNFAPYSKLCIDVTSAVKSTYGPYAQAFGIRIMSGNLGNIWSSTLYIGASSVPITGVYELDISSVTATAFLSILGYAGSGQITFGKVWLE